MAAAIDYFINQINDVRVEVKANFSTLIDKLRQREVQLLSELDIIEEDHQNDKEMVESINKIMLVVKTNTNISNELSKQLAKYDAQAKAKSVKFVCSSEWKREISRMGQISINGVTEPIEYNTKLGPQISVCGRDKEEGQVAESYNYYSAVSHQYSGVAIDPSTNNIYLADYRNSSVSVYNDTGVYLFEFGSNNNNNNVRNDCKMSGPTCIVCYNDTLFISQTGSHCILIYKMDGTLISKFGSYGSDYGQLNDPRGLAICSTTGDIYVCDSSNNRVPVFNSDFKHKTNISFTIVTENVTMGLKSPRDVKLTKDKIIVLDSNEMCVHVYNLKNKQCTHNFISCGNDNRHLCGGTNSYITGSASFIAIDKDDNIIISDCGTNSVRIFTSEGKFFHQIGGSYPLQLISPGGIAIDNKNRLVIANNDSAAIIHIY